MKNNAFGLKELVLDEEYVFNVTIEDGSLNFAGKLKLSRERITLRIMGEQTSTQRCSLGWRNQDQLVCRDLNSTFILLGAKTTSAWSRALGPVPRDRAARTYFETHYEIESVIFSPSHLSHAPALRGLSIHSPTISDWLGNTKKQEQILAAYESKKDFFGGSELLIEFLTNPSDDLVIGIGYDASLYYSSSEFRTGLEFPPYLIAKFHGQINVAQVIVLLNELHALFAFLTGDEIEIEKINFLGQSSSFNSDISFYFPKSRYPNRYDGSTVLFPLGRDLRYQDHPNQLPLEVFSTYFGLDQSTKNLFEKYIRYRRLKNVEERFLGYFRLLEALTRKQKHYLDEEKLEALIARAKPFLVKQFGDKKAVGSFLHGLPRYNASKYNTEKCLMDFHNEIPEAARTTWKYGQDSFKEICKLRNDISHANDYDVQLPVITEMTKFIEALLVLALFLKLDVSK